VSVPRRRQGREPPRRAVVPPARGARPDGSGNGALLSACLIVRNEEKFLDRCLASLAGLVDEIVVVDTGSTDRTREIAAAHGARLDEFPWRGDFAAARNHALDLARSRWILYIDADEHVRPASGSRLRTHLSDPDYVARQVLLHPRPGFTPYWELRLFRNDPLIRFRGIIHENIWPGVHACRAARGGKIGRSDLVLDHEGYERDQDVKHRRNLPLLRKALRREPGKVFSWCHLATIYASLGNERLAERAWKAGLAAARRRRGFEAAEDSLPYIGLIQSRLARRKGAERLLAEALERFPHNHQVRWLRGTAHMKARRFEEAIPCFERLLASGRADEIDRSMAYDVRLFNLFAYDALATCHFKLGRYAESRRYFELAAKHDPEKLEYRVKQAVCARLESGSKAQRRARA
jgi:tetratricopeptide (TPR) repeat protein